MENTTMSINIKYQTDLILEARKITINTELVVRGKVTNQYHYTKVFCMYPKSIPMMIMCAVIYFNCRKKLAGHHSMINCFLRNLFNSTPVLFFTLCY